MSEYKFNTPEVPEAIRKLRHPAYKNIYEYDLGNENLWGTETLLGDWNGKYLLIAKDFYPSSYIKALKDAGDPQPYRHKQDAKTNINLIKTLTHFHRYSGNAPNTTCGFLYISACFLLRADGEKSGPLPDEANVMNSSHPALRFTIEHMPNLRHVVLMGGEAARAEQKTPLGSLLRRNNVHIHRVCHPAHRYISDEERFTQWGPVFGESAVVDRITDSKQWAEPTGKMNQAIQTVSKKDRILSALSLTPQSAGNLMIRTSLSDGEVRNAIGGLRTKYCVWFMPSTREFWIDEPISQQLPKNLDRDRWHRESGAERPS